MSKPGETSIDQQLKIIWTSTASFGSFGRLYNNLDELLYAPCLRF